MFLKNHLLIYRDHFLDDQVISSWELDFFEWEDIVPVVLLQATTNSWKLRQNKET